MRAVRVRKVLARRRLRRLPYRNLQRPQRPVVLHALSLDFHVSSWQPIYLQLLLPPRLLGSQDRLPTLRSRQLQQLLGTVGLLFMHAGLQVPGRELEA